MRLNHFLLALLTIILWGFNFVVIKASLTEISPFLLCAARFFFASLPLVFFIKRPAASFKMVALYGLVMFALQFTLLFTSMYLGMSAGLASLVLQVHIFFTILFAVLFLGELPSRWQVVGAIIAFTGIFLVGKHLRGETPLLGFVLTLLAAATWGTGNLISRKLGKVNMLALVAWSSLVAWPPLLLLAFAVEGYDHVLFSIQHLSLMSMAGIFYIVYPATLFGFGVWNWLLHEYPVATIAPFTLLVPVVGMLSSSLVLGEPLQNWKIIAAILVITGLCINLLAPRLVANFKERHLLNKC